MPNTINTYVADTALDAAARRIREKLEASGGSTEYTGVHPIEVNSETGEISLNKKMIFTSNDNDPVTIQGNYNNLQSKISLISEAELYCTNVNSNKSSSLTVGSDHISLSSPVNITANAKNSIYGRVTSSDNTTLGQVMVGPAGASLQGKTAAGNIYQVVANGEGSQLTSPNNSIIVNNTNIKMETIGKATINNKEIATLPISASDVETITSEQALGIIENIEFPVGSANNNSQIQHGVSVQEVTLSNTWGGGFQTVTIDLNTPLDNNNYTAITDATIPGYMVFSSVFLKTTTSFNVYIWCPVEQSDTKTAYINWIVIPAK